VTISRTLKEFRKLDSNGTGRVDLVTDDPKTGSSRRKLYLPPPLLSAIQRHREFVAGLKRAAGTEWQLSEFVFVSSRGTAVFPSNMTKSFAAFLKTQGLRHIRVHDMRHTAAVLGLTAGVRLEAVSQGLGHSRIDITKSIYAPHVQQLNDEFTRGLSDLVMPIAEKHNLNPIAPEAQHA
jgi:integrase